MELAGLVVAVVAALAAIASAWVANRQRREAQEAAESAADDASRSVNAAEKSASSAEDNAATARGQLTEAIKLREQQVRPYLAVYLEQHQDDKQMVDLVMKNFGPTAAIDISLSLSPVPRQSADDAENPISNLPLPTQVPVLAPGMEWRTFWDFGPNRERSGLEDRHEGAIAYRGSEFGDYTSPVVLDFAYLRATRWTRP